MNWLRVLRQMKQSGSSCVLECLRNTMHWDIQTCRVVSDANQFNIWLHNLKYWKDAVCEYSYLGIVDWGLSFYLQNTDSFIFCTKWTTREQCQLCPPAVNWFSVFREQMCSEALGCDWKCPPGILIENSTLINIMGPKMQYCHCGFTYSRGTG